MTKQVVKKNKKITKNINKERKFKGIHEKIIQIKLKKKIQKQEYR